MKALSSSEVSALIPPRFQLTATTVEDIVFFGQATIREMIRDWRYYANESSKEVKEAEELCQLLRDKTPADIIALAKQYENPTFPVIGSTDGSDPEPLDGASINRRSGATTLNVCGWCRYAGGGGKRYNYMITTCCGIKSVAGMKSESRRFNSPCCFQKMSVEQLDKIRQRLKLSQDRLVAKKRQMDEKIKLLLTLEKKAEKKPPMPVCRSFEWFDLDDVVNCYVEQWESCIVADDFLSAKVINGCHSGDGSVWVCFDKRVSTDKYLNGAGSDYGFQRPEVMHEWEFAYLLEHPDFASIWAQGGISSFVHDFDADKFLAALARHAEKVARGRATES